MSAQMMYLTGEELRKLLRGGKLKVLLFLSFLIGALFVFLSSRIGLSDTLLPVALNLMLTVVLPLFMVVLGSDLMVGEFKDGTIKHVLKLPFSREIIFIGKMFAGWMAGAFIVLSLFGPIFIGSLVLQGMPGLSSLGVSVAEIVGAVVFCGLLVVLANGVSLWTGSSGVGLLVSVAIWMAMGVIGFIEPQLQRLFVTDFADWFRPFLYTGDIGATLTTLLFMIAYYIMGTISGLLAFHRKEM